MNTILKLEQLENRDMPSTTPLLQAPDAESPSIQNETILVGQHEMKVDLHSCMHESKVVESNTADHTEDHTKDVADKEDEECGEQDKHDKKESEHEEESEDEHHENEDHLKEEFDHALEEEAEAKEKENEAREKMMHAMHHVHAEHGHAPHAEHFHAAHAQHHEFEHILPEEEEEHHHPIETFNILGTTFSYTRDQHGNIQHVQTENGHHAPGHNTGNGHDHQPQRDNNQLPKTPVPQHEKHANKMAVDSSAIQALDAQGNDKVHTIHMNHTIKPAIIDGFSKDNTVIMQKRHVDAKNAVFGMIAGAAAVSAIRKPVAQKEESSQKGLFSRVTGRLKQWWFNR